MRLFSNKSEGNVHIGWDCGHSRVSHDAPTSDFASENAGYGVACRNMDTAHTNQVDPVIA